MKKFLLLMGVIGGLNAVLRCPIKPGWENYNKPQPKKMSYYFLCAYKSVWGEPLDCYYHVINAKGHPENDLRCPERMRWVK